METVDKFLAAGAGDGSGYGSGYGYGSGDGAGSGYGSGAGYGDGAGDGYGDGAGSGYGSGAGYGSGYGSGYGDGAGSGYGSGAGDGSGLMRVGGKSLRVIDSIPTIITRVRGMVAKGFIVQADLTLKPCWIARSGDSFAHGETAADAMRDAQSKAFDGMDTESRIEAFWQEFNRDDAYPASAFFEWHGRLTGSCEMGRKQFVSDRQIGMDRRMTVAQFIAIVADQYGGEIIAQLMDGEGE